MYWVFSKRLETSLGGGFPWNDTRSVGYGARRGAESFFVLLVICLLCWTILEHTLGLGPAISGEAKKRPYSSDSPWNLKIGANPAPDSNSLDYVSVLKGPFGCDPDKYTLPVYEVNGKVPVKKVALSGVFSDVGSEGTKLDLKKKDVVIVPLPDDAEPASGSDGQIILWNPETGDEWGFWRMKRDKGEWTAVNGYYYNTNWTGVPPAGFLSRGAGVPYLAGLIRPWEIEQGRIDHAIALGVNYPSSLFVHPATKSDGKSPFEGMPAGTRLQLDPSLGQAHFQKWGLDGPGKIIARTLQEYGMILVDGSGHPKIYAEYEKTAGWNGKIHKNTVKNIPYSAFRVLSLTAPERPAPPTGLRAVAGKEGVVLSWNPSPFASRYRVFRGTEKSKILEVCADEISDSTYTDRKAANGWQYTYAVQAVSYNGVGAPCEPIRIAR